MTSDFQKPRIKDAEPRPDCIIHQGDICPRTGYGLVQGKYAHRKAWSDRYGPIPPGAFILHRCDVRPCVNPDHLFNGNHRANMMDMRAKERGRAPFMAADDKSWREWAEKLEAMGAGAFSGDGDLTIPE
jgi:hypothetical protein